jgi:O-antigen ligase
MIYIFPIITGALGFWRPVWGAAAAILFLPAYLVRGEVLGIPTTGLELGIYALAVAVGIRLAMRKNNWHWVHMTKLTWTLLILWVVAWCLSTVLAENREAALGAMKAWMADPLLFVALLAIVVQTEKDRRAIINASLLSGTIVALAGLVQLVGFRDTLQEGRLSSFFAPVANYAAMYIGPLFVLGAALLLHGERRVWNWITTAIMGVALALTLSFGAYIAVAMGLLFSWIYLPSGKLKRMLLTAGVVGGIIVVALLSQTKNFSQHFDFSGRSSGSVRQQIWVTSWHLIQQKPWFGVGPNNFEIAYREELPKHYFPPLEWLVAQPHNLYLALWLETGLLGLLTFLALFIYHCVRFQRELLPNPAHRTIAIASLAAMIAVMVHGFVDTPYFKNDLAILFLTLAVIPWLGRKNQAD